MTKYTHKKISAKLAAKAEKATGDISHEDVSELEAIGEDIRSLGRRTTGQGYELGSYLARAKAILPERAFGAWVKAICKFTPKTARNYVAVHENLAAYKERLVTTGTAPTTLFILAHADKEKVEDVVTAFELGEKLTVAQVKAMVGAAPAKKMACDTGHNLGGATGLRKIAQLKVAEDSVKFFQLVMGILSRVEKALEPLDKKRSVVKGALQKSIVHDCRHAHDLINSIAAPLEPSSMVANTNWQPAKLPEGTAWRNVQALLLRMGGVEAWPDRHAFVPWLQTEVVPLLRFVVHGEALPADVEDETPGPVAAQREEDADDGFLAYDQMPPDVQDTIDRALAIVSPDSRDEIRAQIMFDPRPIKRRAACGADS
ncbi:hypothetical protein M0654_18095 [Rhizobium sp. NTR19]|uniref:DUF3102 domain-containing protein n=1 Tax=Neorhizobium turbinariae TaxID=2937795 RepID=A0ABT0IVI7_9HYPH|nr:hypothetical protein [Neorhizobium turbinariae]MCK8781896.1 hypothetical protein [Neorhizobium turbinariae]